MEQELAYSFHLGSDKNKSKLAKKVAKENLSGTTCLSNNAIQNAKDLSDVNKHNLRYFDNQTELIRTIYGTSDIVNDVKQVYWDEFEQARIEYNNKQTREDRKIEDYFKKVCDSQNDIACEIIIELGDMDFWNDKDERYRLTQIQDKMRNACIKSFNKFYDMDFKLKEKQKGRNQDINVKDMGDYRKIKKQLAKKEQKLEKANTQIKELYNTGNDVNKILDNLKPTLMNKNNIVISSESVQKLKNYTKDVKNITKTVRSVNDLNMAIKDFEHSVFKIEKENRSLKYQLELKDDEIDSLKGELSTKDKIIGKLQVEKEKLKQELHKFKDFWHSIMKYFHKRICYDKDENYKIVSKDLYKNGIFTDDENEIANDITRKVEPKEDIEKSKTKKKDNFELK